MVIFSKKHVNSSLFWYRFVKKTKSIVPLTNGGIRHSKPVKYKYSKMKSTNHTAFFYKVSKSLCGTTPMLWHKQNKQVVCDLQTAPGTVTVTTNRWHSLSTSLAFNYKAAQAFNLARLRFTACLNMLLTSGDITWANGSAESSTVTL